MQEYINTQHKYLTLDYYLKERFKTKVFKVSLNGDFTCPNRDGTINTSGCIFCSDSGSGDFAGSKDESLEQQFANISKIIHAKWPIAKYIAYFQANTNTYKPLHELKNLYEKALAISNDIICLSIATRPDCLSTEILDYLEELNQRVPVWIELGLQTVHNETARLINRGYELNVFDSAVRALRQRKIEVIVHIINGLPHETEHDMYATIKHLNKCDIQGIKIHSLFILKGSEIEKMYQNGLYNMMSLSDYVRVTANQLALLNKSIVIHRVNGDPPKENLVAPLWSLKKFVVMNEIDKYMKDHNLYQGSKDLTFSCK